MGSKAQCRAFDPGWITRVILLGVKYLLPPEGKVNFLCLSCLLYCIFFAGGAYSQPCLEYRIYSIIRRFFHESKNKLPAPERAEPKVSFDVGANDVAMMRAVFIIFLTVVSGRSLPC
jgi:hypothetical protein